MSAFEHVRGQRTRILVLNPNSSQSMSNGMKHVIDSLDLPHSTQVDIYTAPPSSPASIDDAEGIQQSSKAVLADPKLAQALGDGDYDGIVVACYSVDPLVHELRHLAATSSASASAGGADTSGKKTKKKKKLAVMGIFEASILTALSLLENNDDEDSSSSHGEHKTKQQQQQKWGIVTTGNFWEGHLTRGVADFLGCKNNSAASTITVNDKFAGVHTTGLNAGDFHKDLDPAEIERRLKVATKKCLEGGNTRVIIMGCAGMAGLEDTIRAAAEEEFGEYFAHGELHVLDAVRAGVMQVEQVIRHQRLLSR